MCAKTSKSVERNSLCVKTWISVKCKNLLGWNFKEHGAWQFVKSDKKI
jgi:hypothetical protein